MDRWLVLKDGENGKYIVYEGNRRLAALKILNNPSVLGDLELAAPLRRKFESIAKNFDPDTVGKIDCSVIANRAEGALWLHQRHTGENKGTGIVRWGGLATARFRGSDPALQALEAVLRFTGLDTEQQEELEGGFPITNLDRLLSSVSFRHLIGFDVKQSKLITDIPPKPALRILKRIVKDLSDGIVNVTQIKLKADQIAYAKTLGKDLPDLSTRTGNWDRVEDWDEATFSDAKASGTSGGSSGGRSAGSDAGGDKKTEPTKKPTKAARSSVRKTLITRDCVLNVTNPKVIEIEKELRSLQLATHRHAIAVLFRVFLEISVDVYLRGKGVELTVNVKGHIKDKSLSAKVQDAIKEMVASGVPEKHLDGVSKGINNAKNALHINTLHGYVHNEFYSPMESDLSVAFDNARPFFETIWK